MSMNDNIVGYELSENQKNLWNVSKNYVDFFYNQVILNVKNNLSVEDFLNALNVVIKNNDVLKFKLVQDSNFTYPFQIDSTNNNVVWYEIDLSTNIAEVDTILNYSYDPLSDSPVRICFAKDAGQLKQVVLRLYSLWGDAYSCFYLCDEIGKIILSKENYSIEEKETIDYASFSTWQNDLINEPEREAIVFWKNYNYQLTNALIPFSNEATAFNPQKKEIVTITGDDYFKIKDYCLTNNCQIRSVFLLNFISYLFQFSEDELTIGLSRFKREYDELDNTLGLVSKNIPLKINKGNEFSFTEALKNIETQIGLVEEWSDFFTLNRGDAATSFSKTAYFNYCFEFIDFATTFQEASDLFDVKELHAIQDIFDLKISCLDLGNSFSVALYYNQESFNEAAIDIILGQFQKNYSALIGNANFEISDTEKNIIEASNTTHKNFEEYTSVVQLFDKQSELFPDSISLFNDSFELSYSELQTRSNQFKNYLIEEHNIKKGDAICIVGEGSEWLITCILGIIKAGAYYIPIDNKYPKERIEYIINESNCKVSISDPNNEIVSSITHIAKIDPFNSEIWTTERKNHVIEIKPEDLVYCIYTSGSTGNPKGCIISHSSLLNYIQWANEYYFENSHYGNWGLITSISFDLTVTSIFTSLTRGKKLWLGDFKKDINELLIEAFSNPEIDTLKLTPAHISLLGELEIKSSTIKKIICGGEKLLRYQVEVLKNINNEIAIYNEYGPTETTVGCSIYEVKSSNDNITIGKPIANTAIYILTDNKLYAPIGVSGEIFIGGSGLAQGYLNRLDLTTEKFIVNPFVDGERLYKTGDIGRWLPDGIIEYLGRIDDQVKIRGYRIELGEIEQFISNQDFINQSVVIVKERENEKFLVAYYVSEKEIDKKVLQDNLKKVLPDYMAPSYYVQLDAIPMTSNGKVDRKALPGIDNDDLIKAEYIAARTTEEALLVQIWTAILKHDLISVKDSFYNLGGDSIKSILVVSRLRQQGYSLKVDQILRNPVLENLAKLIESNTQFIDQAEVKGNVVLTPVQRDFFENETITNKNYFNQSVLLKSDQIIDSALLERCITALVLHHDALRMVYTPEQGSWQQYNADSSEAHYKIDFYDLREDSNQTESLSKIGAQLQSSLAITSGKLFQVGHFRMSDGDRLALIIHHLVIDGISWRILLEDFSNLYEGYQNNSAFSLLLKTDSFKRWASLQQEYAVSDKMQQERLYWEELTKTPIALLPNNLKQGEDSKTNQSKGFVLDAAITQKLQTQSHQVYNTEINDILLTGLGLAIREVFAVEKTVIKMEGHGREEIIDGVDIGRTIGWFTSLYPFILDISDSENHVLVAVKEALRKIPNKGIGYSILKYMDKDFSNELIPSIQFNYLGDFGNNTVGSNKDSLFNFSSEDIGPSVAASNKQSEVLLDINGMMVSGELSLRINYSSHAFNHEIIEKLVISYENQLHDLIETLTKTEENHLTSSDLTYKFLAYNELLVLNRNKNIEDIYELSPSQQGMYYHWLINNSSQMYFMQTSYRLHFNDLSVDVIKQAYEQLIKRYSILRTSFSNNYRGVPLQIVHNSTPNTFSYEQVVDISDVEAYLYKVKEEDKSTGFNFETPTLMRLKVLDLGKEEYDFIWSYHHILMDGWCISILINDFYKILVGITNHEVINLPEPTKYSNYIDWLSKIDKKASLRYWKNYLEGLESITEIPFKNDTDKSNGAVEFKNESFLIEGELFQNISNLCQELEITPNTFIQGVWGYLLSRYNSTQDVVFGSVVSGRSGEIPGIENMVGLFMNMIPVRINYSKGDTTKSFLKKIHLDTLESTSHHYLNLSEVQSQSILGMELINNFIVFENYLVQDYIEDEQGESSAENERKITVEKIIFSDQANYNFGITILPSPSFFGVEFKFNSGVFNSELIKKLVVHFQNLTKQFSSKDSLLLEEITYLSNDEKKELLLDFNDTTVDYPSNKTLVDLFEEQVAKTPYTVALVFENRRITYKELDTLSTQLSKSLRKDYGVEKGNMVGVQLNRSEWYIISILGILKSGAVYVPIDSDLPITRKAFIVEDTALKLLISETSFIFELDFYQGNVLSIDVEFEPSSYEDIVLDKVELKPHDLAYIIYTSGSTGVPKGVMLEHLGVVNTALSQIDLFDLSESINSLQFSSFSFDASIWEIFITLLSGCSLYILDDKVRNNTKLFEEYIVENHIAIATLPPAYLKLLDIDKLKGLKILITAGEAPVYNKVQEYLKYGTFYNAYGPTEASICGTIYKIEKGTELDSPVIPIGKPIANASIYVVDEFNTIQASGVIGEICIGGPGLARGYLNKPELTSEKFIPNPFKSGSKLYKTGDLGRWLPDGNVEYLGRIDDQVKIRGHRIELGEIEFKLSQYSDAIKQTLILVKIVNGEKEIVAYYVSEKEIDKSELRSYLIKMLPEYMVPGFYVKLDVMPVTSNGKTDRKALPGISREDLIKKEYEAPRNEMEQKLVEIWQDVLAIEKIGINDNFFELGGNSLLALQVFNKMKMELGKNVAFTVFFENPMIKYLNSYLEDSVYTAIPKTLELSSYPLTSTQLRLWILSQLEEGSLAYNMPASVKFTGTIDVYKFQEAFRLLIDRHEILRTYFKADEYGQICQYVVDFEDVFFEIKEQDFRDKKDQTGSVLEQIQIINSEPFNLEQVPLLRASIICLSNTSHVFSLSMHHIIGDGWSLELLISEIVQIYNLLVQGKSITLPELKIQYKDYAVWLNDNTVKEKQQISEQYWLDKFSGELPLLTLPSFKPRPLIKTYNGDRSSHVFSKIFLDKIQHFSKQEDVTMFMIFMTALKLLLHKYSNQTDIIVGTSIAGREHPDLEHQVGLFLNALAIRTIIKEGESFRDLVKREKENLSGAYEHQDYAFGDLVDKLQLKNDRSRSALFDVMIDLQNQMQLNNLNNGDSLQDLIVEGFEAELKSSKFDLEFNFVEIKESLLLNIVYNTDIYDAYQIQDIFVHLENLFLQVLDNPEILIQELDFLSQEEKEKLLVDFNNTVVEYPKDKSILDLFEQQVILTPDAIALIFENKKITYKELDTLSDGLSKSLRKTYGIAKGDMIGVQLNRNEWCIISILGILKSGGVYIPIDSELPINRKAFIVQDTALKLLITETSFLFELDFYKGEVLSVDVEFDSSAYEDISIDKVELELNDLAYIIYTSGSTGNPKGVMIEHSSLTNYLTWAQEYYLEGELRNKNFGLFTSLSFDLTITSLFLPLISGGSLQIIGSGNNISIVLKQYLENDISCIKLTPAHISVLEGLNIQSNKIELAIVGGEELRKDHVEILKRINPSIRIYNEYGPTETTVGCSIYEVKSIEESIKIGKPIANTSIYILDAFNNLQPSGVIGELCIGGSGLARGYLNREDLTADKFIAHPFIAGERLYKTGDIARWLPEGNIEYFGRIDDQVKIRGYRIELGEIEINLFQYSASIKQVVVEVKTINNEKVIVAYYVSEQEIDKSELRSYMAKNIPEYMVPDFYVALDSIPLTSNGKINRRALPSITGEDLVKKEYVAPRNKVEQKLIEIIVNILDCKDSEIGINDNFFDLGMNSLSLIKMVGLVKLELKTELTISMLFEFSNVSQLSDKIFNLISVGADDLLESSEDYVDLSQETEDFLEQIID